LKISIEVRSLPDGGGHVPDLVCKEQSEKLDAREGLDSAASKAMLVGDFHTHFTGARRPLH
jgi:hypothetical protein